MRLLGCAPRELNDNETHEHLRDRSEGVRIAYVAATRARDLLVVPTVGDGPIEGWAETLNPALYPTSGKARKSMSAPGCPAFGNASVLERPPNLMSSDETSVHPGLHRPGSGNYDVVWWDPALLALDHKANFGILQEHILTARDSGGAAEQSVRDYSQWKESRRHRLAAGATPSMDIFSPSDAAAPVSDSAGARFEVQVVDREADRPGGARFGSLVHLLLRHAWEVGGARDELATLADFHGRILDAPIEERAAAVTTTRRTLQHPLMRRAARASRRHQEYPVTFRTRQGRIMEGVIDLMFEEAGEWHVVDFKTDTDIDSLQQRHQTQLGWYVEAVSRVMLQPAKGYVLGV
jgi:ATP-dependent exoDNAse (exonuclease V) beta subunit